MSLNNNFKKSVTTYAKFYKLFSGNNVKTGENKMYTVNSGNTNVRKYWTKREIANNVQNNYEWTKRAILALYERQTIDEQISQHTNHDNNRGYNKTDARFMSSLAEWIKSNRSLTSKQLFVARKKLEKYHAQLTDIANGKR